MYTALLRGDGFEEDEYKVLISRGEKIRIYNKNKGKSKEFTTVNFEHAFGRRVNIQLDKA